MNTWQLSRQLKYLLQNATWPDGDAHKVLGFVAITSGTEEQVWGKVRTPFCLISPGSADPDQETSRLLRQQFSMALGVRGGGDPYGESSLIGRNRMGTGKSANRGLLEVEEEVLKGVGDLRRNGGVNLRAVWRSAVGAGSIAGLGVVSQRAYTIEATCTTERYYHPPRNLAKSGSTLTWALPPDRYDRYAVIINRVSGSDAPTSPTEGTQVYSGLATTVEDSPAGTWTYAAWAAYDETNTTPSEAQRYSEASASIPGTTL